jgi:nucleoside-diphosphate-sugar epimerase
MKEVLITGANGFLGNNLAELLIARGYSVSGLVREKSSLRRLDPQKIKIFRFNGFDDSDAIRRAVSGKSFVFNLAGAARALDVEMLFQVNRDGTRRLFEACADMATPPVVVHVSSLAAAGPSNGIRPRIESDPSAPVSDYGKSKRAGEWVVREFADRVPATIVRPSIVIGPGKADSFGWFKSALKIRAHGCPRKGLERFSIIHVADLSQILLSAAEKGWRVCEEETDAAERARGVYFAASMENLIYAELGPILRDAVDRNFIFCMPFPMPVVWTVAACTELISHIIRRPIFLNMDKAREIAAGSWACSSQAAVEQLDFKPGASLEERIHETADWYFNNGWLRRPRFFSQSVWKGRGARRAAH